MIIWLIDSLFKMKREGAVMSNFISFSLRVCVCVLLSMVSCFINFSFNSFVISNWIYFVVIERKKIYHLHWIANRGNILRKYIIYIFFNFGHGFCSSFPLVFPKLQLLVVKQFWTNFCCIVLLHLWAQKASLRFLKPYFNLEMLVFLSLVVSFLVDMFK